MSNYLPVNKMKDVTVHISIQSSGCREDPFTHPPGVSAAQSDGVEAPTLTVERKKSRARQLL